MDTFLLFYTILITASLSISVFVFTLHILIKKLLRPPGDLIFAQSIAQIIIDIHWFTGFVDRGLPENGKFCKIAGGITVFFTVFSMNCILALCIEIFFKLSNRTKMLYKTRLSLYYILNISFGLFLVILAELHGDFGYSLSGTCTVKPGSLTSNIRLASFAVDIVIQLVLISLTMKQVGLAYSSVIINYFYVVLFESIFVLSSNSFKYLAFITENKNAKLAFSNISALIGAATGAAIGICRLWNKRLIKRFFWIFRRRTHTSARVSVQSSEDSLTELNIYNVHDLFSVITHRALIQMLIVVNLRIREKNKEFIDISQEKDYDEYLFDQKLFNDLSEEYGIKQLREIYSPDLHLIEYLPEVFLSIRKHLKISETDLLKSFGIAENLAQLGRIKHAEGGRSEATIFFTADRQFVLKTISAYDRRFIMKEFIKKFSEHIKQDSFLARIIAMFKLIPANTDYIIMENVVANNENAVIFDVKGSTVNRKVEEDIDYSDPPYGRILKDLNLIESGYKIKVDEDKRDWIIEVLERDAKFLGSIFATDYSVLIAFYKRGVDIDSRYSVKGVNVSYSISIIDYLQKFDIKKKSEKFLKKIVYNDEISVEEPCRYIERLMNFVKKFLGD